MSDQPLALQLLDEDHALVHRLLGEMRGRADWTDVRTELCEALERHLRVEETVFYPALARLEMLASFVARMYDQHARLREALQELSTVNAGDDAAMRDAAKRLAALFDAHIAEEEKRAFKYAIEHLANELDALAVELEHCRNAAGGAYGVG